MLRLYDVLISGPLYTYLSVYIDNIFLKLFVFITGFMTIVFNGWNMLYYNQYISNGFLTNKDQGKFQIHRLYNLIIMYPLLTYANYISSDNPDKPEWLTYIIYLIIFLGFAFNLYYLVLYSGIYARQDLLFV